MMNVLAYADDIALIVPSWTAMQYLIEVLEINMICNTDKTVRMIFKPCCKSKIVSQNFPSLIMSNAPLRFVVEFRYLGHILNNEFTDDDDIKREVQIIYL